MSSIKEENEENEKENSYYLYDMYWKYKFWYFSMENIYN
jgi:hypothetical protein